MFAYVVFLRKYSPRWKQISKNEITMSSSIITLKQLYRRMSKVFNIKKSSSRMYIWRMRLNFLKKKGLNFVHLNCNSLLSKIDEIREFVLQNKAHAFLRQNLTQLSPAQKFWLMGIVVLGVIEIGMVGL